MKVVTRKIFKFRFHLKHHRRRVEKLKVTYCWKRCPRQNIFIQMMVFQILFFVVLYLTFQGRSWIQTQMPQGMRHLLRWLLSIYPFFSTGHPFQNDYSQIPCPLSLPVFKAFFICYLVILIQLVPLLNYVFLIETWIMIMSESGFLTGTNQHYYLFSSMINPSWIFERGGNGRIAKITHNNTLLLSFCVDIFTSQYFLF